ncbi:MAG: hypothetical protein JWO18_758 [Microbacteriaceae bacterium]|jgi:hypothetical protein|nr:hypothetical protein [Microbacteriaceae bacterium]
MTSDDGLFTAAELTELLALARALYPHDALADGPYERTIAKIVVRASAEPALWHVLHDGLAEIRGARGDLHSSLEVRVGTPFFESLRALVAWHLYDDHEVWDFIGYPGASFDRGGYLHRGFDDLDWLPEPRVQESTKPFETVATSEENNS